MGKYKDIYIEKEDIIKEVSIDKFNKNDDMYIYLLAPKDRLHLWGWTNFGETIKGRLLDYGTQGNVILYQVIETSNLIDMKILEEFGLIVQDKR